MREITCSHRLTARREVLLPSAVALVFVFVASTRETQASWPAGASVHACAADSAVAVTGPFRAQGHAFVAQVADVATLGDRADAPRQSPFLLCEDGRVIGRPHVAHDEIRQLGRGRFSHWQGHLYFSTSDHSNPNVNGRRYRLVRADRPADPMPPVPVLGVGALPDRHVADVLPPACGTFVAATHEHEAAQALVPKCAATHVAVRTGAWSSPTTWSGQQVPGPDARVRIPTGLHVVLDTTAASPSLDWLRVEGRLSTSTDRNADLTLRTLVVTPGGQLDIGTPSAPVRAGVMVRVQFAPRRARNRSGDPFDLAGGLISLGRVRMVAEAKSSHMPAAALARRASEVVLAEAASGWAAGDTLLVPGTDTWTDQDEVRTITAVLDGGRRLRLDQPLQFDHTAPAGVAIPIGNLTRAIELRSLVSSPLAARAHVMFMHVQTGTHIDGVAFRDLGRTDTRIGHSIPALDASGATVAGTDLNTVGRYPVHFHVRGGARIDVAPHVVKNSVVVNSPKYGIVNHGGHVVAEGNVTFRVHGSHLVAENGSEVGAFIGNMAVRSNGSGDPSILSRMGLYDNAHGGNGIWLTSGGVRVQRNWASGHADSGIKMLAMAFIEQGQEVFFDGRNLGSPEYADDQGRVRLSDVPVHLSGNTVTASAHGIELWNHREFAGHLALSRVDDTVIWNVQSTAVFLPYTSHTAVRNLRAWGPPQGGDVAVDGNHTTGSITVDGGSIVGFSVGVRLPRRGTNLLRRLALHNDIDIEIPPPVDPGRRIVLEAVEFAGAMGAGRRTIAMGPPELPFSGDAAVLFANDSIALLDASGRSRRLYFPAQRPSAIPLARMGPSSLRGLTNRQLMRQFGLAFGGGLAPESAPRLAWSNALVAEATQSGVPRDTARGASSNAVRGAVDHALYDPRVPKGVPSWAVNATPDWEQVRVKFAAATAETLRGSTSAVKKFMVHPSLLPLEIHPDDVRLGYRILGYVVDRVDGRARTVAHFEEFRDLKVDADGFVRVWPRMSDVHGTQAPHVIALRVTNTAVRRGRNLDYFMQAHFCGTCGFESVESAAERLLAADVPSNVVAGLGPP